MVSKVSKPASRGGRPLSGNTPSKAVLVELYVKKELSLRAIGEATGATKDTIHRALKRYGIETRPAPRRAGLQAIGLKQLRADVKAQGLRGTARILGVDKRAVSYHLKKCKGK
jgi:DNA-binding transcriptional ArsR family regulator